MNDTMPPCCEEATEPLDQELDDAWSQVQNLEDLLSSATTFTLHTLKEIPITVEYRGDGYWAICRGRYNFDGETWELEASPSNRSEYFLKQFRFNNRDEAIRLARTTEEI
jgi:hypothetical protein